MFKHVETLEQAHTFIKYNHELIPRGSVIEMAVLFSSNEPLILLPHVNRWIDQLNNEIVQPWGYPLPFENT